MDVIDYEDLYTIDREGNVFGKKRKKYLKHQLNNGYYCIKLHKNNIKTEFTIHRLIALHFIPNPLKLPWIDHENGIITDNRIKNLRWVTTSQNSINSKKREDNTSGYRGVHFHKRDNKYQARITINNKRLSLGLYNTAEEASKVYEAKAIELFGEFKRDTLNA